MQTGTMAFTAVYLRGAYGYVGFIEEIPGVNAHAATLEEARDKLREVVEAVFAAERQNCRELLAGKDAVREDLVVTFAPHVPPNPDLRRQGLNVTETAGVRHEERKSGGTAGSGAFAQAPNSAKVQLGEVNHGNEANR